MQQKKSLKKGTQFLSLFHHLILSCMSAQAARSSSSRLCLIESED